MRRAQGSTLDLRCLWFDHCHPPFRGYAFTGVSRFKRAIDVMLMGKARTTVGSLWTGHSSREDNESHDSGASTPREDVEGDDTDPGATEQPEEDDDDAADGDDPLRTGR